MRRLRIAWQGWRNCFPRKKKSRTKCGLTKGAAAEIRTPSESVLFIVLGQQRKCFVSGLQDNGDALCEEVCSCCVCVCFGRQRICRSVDTATSRSGEYGCDEGAAGAVRAAGRSRSLQTDARAAGLKPRIAIRTAIG